MSEITENSAKLHWDRPEPSSPYFYDLTVTSAHDQSLVLKQNVTVTDRVIGGLRAGQTYHVAVVCYLRSQVRATYRGSFSTSEYVVGLRKVGTLIFHVEVLSTRMSTGYRGNHSSSNLF